MRGCDADGGVSEKRESVRDSDNSRLPNFFIIGASKAGTTSLYFYLRWHPDVSMSSVKETNFFLGDDYMERLDEYQGYFDPGARLRGEASPRYSAYPLFEGVPERIHSLVPNPRLIYLVRDPVDRAIAHYYQRLALNQARETIEAAFADLGDPRNPFLCASRYAQQVARYTALFPRENLLIIDSSDLRRDRRATLRSVFAFLGADEDFWSPRFGEEFNTTAGKRRPRRVQRWLRRTKAADAASRVLPPGARKRLSGVARRALSVQLEPPPAELRERIGRALAEDTERFRELSGRRFEHWSI